MAGRRSPALSLAQRRIMMRENLERFWQSVARRDRAADGRFVYAVGTTGVYCRPVLPEPEAEAGQCRVLRQRGGGGAGGLSPVQALPAAAGCGGSRAAQRCAAPAPSSTGARGWRARAVARCARPGGGIEPVSSAAPLQAHARHLAARIRRCAAARPRQGAAQGGRRRRRRALCRGLWLVLAAL